MVRANFSFGGKLLLILVTVIIYTFVLIGGIIGGALYAYNSVKVGDLLNMLGQSQWVSEEYAQKTLQQFISDIQKDLSGEGLTLQRIIDISPQTEKILDGVLDNVDQNGIVTIDRTALYSTPVQNLSSSLTDIAVVTATLDSLQDSMHITLPDMPVISGGEAGSEIWLYVAVNNNEERTADKAFRYGSYTYFTRSEKLSDEPVTERETVSFYSLDGVSADTDGWLRTADGRNIYRKISVYDADGNETDARYERLSEDSSCVRADQDGGFLFTTNALFRKSGLGGSSDSYVALDAQAAGSETEITVPMKYRYLPLYLEDGTPATQGPDSSNGQYTVLPEYEGQDLYCMEDVYTQVDEKDMENGMPTQDFLLQNLVYVRSNGLTQLPILSAINALSDIFNVDTLTLRKAGEYFGVDLNIDMLEDILDVPLAHLGSSFDSAVENIELGRALNLGVGSEPLLLYLAYGEEGVDYVISGDSIEMLGNSKPKTIGEVTDSFGNITIGNVVGKSDHPLMQAISGWTLNDFADADKIDSLTIGDILNMGENPSAIILALQDVSLGELSTAIDDLSLKDMIGEIDPSNSILYALKDCTLSNISDVIQTLSLQDLFAEDLYGYLYIGTANGGADEDGNPTQKYDGRYEQLFVLENLEYVQKTAAEIEELPADTKIYARYILAFNGTSYAQGYENIPLYAWDADSGEYVEATYVSAWKMPSGYDASRTYYTYSEADGKYTPVPAENLGGTFGTDTLYYLNEDDDAAEISLIPAQLSVLDEYAGRNLYSMYRLAQTVGTGADAYYTQANLYYYDAGKQSFERIKDLIEVRAQGAEETDPVIGYRVPDAYAGTTIFTHGEVQGIWKYMLTNENGAEEIAALTDIGTLMSNITYNINHKTLQEMCDDGVLEINSADGSDPLKTVIPDILVDEADRPAEGNLTLGELSISDLLNITVRALGYLNDPSTIPGFGG